MSEELQQAVTAESLDGSTEQPNAEAAPVETPEVDEDTLKEAKRQGWVPQEEYEGPADKWVDADTFVKKGREINAILRKDNEFLKREVAEMKSTMLEFKKFHAETEKRAYERAMQDLREQKKEAISQGDGDRVLEIDDAIDELKEKRQEVSETKAAPYQQPDATFVEWSSENQWYVNDTELKAEADLIGQAIKARQPNLIGKDFLNEVAKRVKKMYPEKFTNTNRGRPSAVETGSPAPARGKVGKTFNDLPAEAKAACQKFEKSGLLTRDQYLKEYFGE